jgi:hypothetical protein
LGLTYPSSQDNIAVRVVHGIIYNYNRLLIGKVLTCGFYGMLHGDVVGVPYDPCTGQRAGISGVLQLMNEQTASCRIDHQAD